MRCGKQTNAHVTNHYSTVCFGQLKIGLIIDICPHLQNYVNSSFSLQE